ncbi:MAG: hypothetical protein ACLGGX_10955 [Bdellovibrionia bacterium]
MVSFRTFSILLCLMLSSCTFSKKTPDEMKAEAFDEVTKKLDVDSSTASITKEDVTVYLEGVPDTPNSYDLVVKLNKKVPFLSVAVGGIDGNALANADEYRVNFSNRPLGETGEFEVKTYLRSKKSASTIKFETLIVPIDLVLTNSTHFGNNVSAENQDRRVKEHIKFNRIFIQKDVSLFTYGSEFVLEADEIIAYDKFTITTYEKMRGMRFNRNKMSVPASITIKARKAVGRFFVSLIGAPGKRGYDGIESLKEDLMDNYFIALRGKDGEAGLLDSRVSLTRGRLDSPNVKEQLICKKAPTNGSPGRDADEFHGGNGHPGEDVGNLIIEVEDYSQARFVVQHQGGKGGRGGFPFPHDLPGGVGGKAGKWPGDPCPKAADGAPGKTVYAKDLVAGEPGADGTKGNTIVPQSPTHFQIL